MTVAQAVYVVGLWSAESCSVVAASVAEHFADSDSVAASVAAYFADSGSVAASVAAYSADLGHCGWHHSDDSYFSAAESVADAAGQHLAGLSAAAAASAAVPHFAVQQCRLPETDAVLQVAASSQ